MKFAERAGKASTPAELALGVGCLLQLGCWDLLAFLDVKGAAKCAGVFDCAFDEVLFHIVK